MHFRPWTAFAIPAALNIAFIGAGLLIVAIFSGSVDRIELFLPVIVLIGFAVAPIVEGALIHRAETDREASKRRAEKTQRRQPPR